MFHIQNFMQQVLKESSKKLNEDLDARNYKNSVLAIITGGSIGEKEAFFCLKGLKQKGYNTSLLVTPAAMKIHGYEKLATSTDSHKIICDDNLMLAESLLKSHRQIVIPILTTNSAAKIANGSWDTLATYLVYQALVAGKTVVAAKDSCCSMDSYGENKGLEKLLSKNLKGLEELGIKLTYAKDLEDFFPSFIAEEEVHEPSCKPDSQSVCLQKKIITRDDLLIYKNTAKTITLGKSSIVTDLAKEFAATAGIKFAYKDS